MFRLVTLSLILLLVGSEYLQSQTSPKRELRAVWVATVVNIDWPSRAGLGIETQKKEIRDLLDFHHRNGMNAIVMQVRPAGDAFYYSPYEPWSEWLMGEQGRAPSPYYDPLTYYIEECHKRGMEFHAWFNPYRAARNYDSTKVLANNHLYHQHPEWFLQYGTNLYFDPGLPDVRDHVSRVILDVVNRYDIDAVHFDDYFYPYKIPEVAFPDTASYARYGSFFKDVGDWRRDNVSLFIESLGPRIKRLKPWVKFGISPFSVWRNKSVDPLGSDTRAGQTCYDDLYADVKLWLAEGWIDYIAPQLYFSIGYGLVSYDIALDWWRANANRRHIYVGHGAYKINNNADTLWNDANQIPSQINLNRKFEDVHGSIYFSAKSFKENPLGINDSLQNNYYRKPALVPVMPWLEDRRKPNSPDQLEASSQQKGVVLSWEAPIIGSTPAYYAIYRFRGKVPGSINSSEHLIDVIGASENFYVDRTVSLPGKYTYIVTTLDRLQRESGPDNPYFVVRVKRKYLRSGVSRGKTTLSDLIRKN